VGGVPVGVGTSGLLLRSVEISSLADVMPTAYVLRRARCS
jgi:hypothetical protein